MRLDIVFLCSAVLFLCVARAGEVSSLEQPKSNDMNIVEVLKADGNYKILVSALESTGVDKTLQSGGPYTFFAPTDGAFALVPNLNDLLKDNARLTAILRHHIVDGRRLDTLALRSEALLQPLQGKALKISTEPELRIDDDSKIVHANRDMKTGIFHGIDHVLMENNDSVVRESAGKVEDGLKDGTKKVHDGLKTGARKIENAFK